MRTDFEALERDIFERACIFALASDVVSADQKRRILRRLATVKLTFDCRPGTCHTCRNAVACDDFATNIMAS